MDLFKFCSGILLCITIGCTTQKSILDKLPSDSGLPGWEEDNSDIYKGEEALTTYINGGARLYGSYGFEEAATRSFSSTEKGIFTIELYRMKDTQGAFGVYTFNRSGKSIGIGSLGCYDTGLLQFWKGSYYGRLLMFGGPENPEAHLTALAGEISDKIKYEDKIPSIMSCLPEAGLMPESTRFILDYLQVNNLYYLANYDILNISSGAEGAYGQYRGTQNSLQHLLIVQYKSNEEAESTGVDFAKNFPSLTLEPDNNFPEEPLISKGENKRWTGLQLLGNYLILVFDAASEEDAGELIQKTAALINAHRQDDT